MVATNLIIDKPLVLRTITVLVEAFAENILERSDQWFGNCAVLAGWNAMLVCVNVYILVLFLLIPLFLLLFYI